MNVPPLHGGRSWCRRLVAQHLLADPDRTVLYVGRDEPAATAFGRGVRALSSTPDLPGESASSSEGTGGLWCTSIGAAPIDLAAELLVIDDPTSFEDASRQTVRDARERWYRSAIARNLAPGGKVLVLQSRVHIDDLSGRLLRTGDPGLCHLNLPALAEEDDPLGRAPGEPLVPEKFDAQQLLERRAEIGGVVFAAQYQGRPAPDRGAVFQAQTFRYYAPGDDGKFRPVERHEAPVRIEDLDVFTVVDPASSTEITADPSVIAVFAATRGKLPKVFLVNLHRERLEGPELRRAIVDVSEAWPGTPVFVESTGAQAYIAQDLREAGIDVRELRPTLDKVTRANRYALPLFQAGRFLFPHSAPFTYSLEQELLAFHAGLPPSQHDDQADVITHAAFIATTGLLEGNNTGTRETLPAIELLDKPEVAQDSEAILNREARAIERVGREHGVELNVVSMQRGPALRSYQATLGAGVRVASFLRLADELNLELADAGQVSLRSRTQKGRVGVDVPAEDRAVVTVRELAEELRRRPTTAPLVVPFGKDYRGKPIALAPSATHMVLAAGSTRAGKSVFLRSFMAWMLLNHDPSEVRIWAIDTQAGVSLVPFSGIPHLERPVLTRASDAIEALEDLRRVHEQRLALLALARLDSYDAFNALAPEERVRRGAPDPSPLPFVFLVIEEYADLLRQDLRARDLVANLAATVAKTGVMLLVATQRPSAELMGGDARTNFPTRLAFRLSSAVDSRVVSVPQAEQLLGRGDFILVPPAGTPIRGQAPYISADEIERLVDHWRALHPEPRKPAHQPEECLEATAARANEEQASSAGHEREPTGCHASIPSDPRSTEDRLLELLELHPRALTYRELEEALGLPKALLVRAASRLHRSGAISTAKLGSRVAYFHPDHHLRPDLGLLSPVLTARLMVREPEARRIIRRAMRRGFFGRREELASLDFEHIPLRRVEVQPADSSRRGRRATLHHVLYFSAVSGDYLCCKGRMISFRAPPPNELHQTRGLESLAPDVFEETMPGDLCLDEDQLRQLLPDRKIDLRARRVYDVNVLSLQLVFLPVWRALVRDKSSQEFREQCIDGVAGRSVDITEPE